MKLFLLSQDYVSGYDTYDSAVVAAESESDARNIHPYRFVTHITNGEWMGTYSGGDKIGEEYPNNAYGSWPKYSDIEHIKVKYLGDTKLPIGLILASFNAG